MPRRKEAEPLIKVTLNLYRSSYRRMQELYPSMGAAKAIREIARNHVAQVDMKLARSREEDLVTDVQIELEDKDD